MIFFSSIKHICIYFTLMLFVGGPGPALHLNMGIPGPLNRIVLFYNVYTTLQFTISYYFILLYNTLLRTVRIQIHYYSPGCSYCSCSFYYLAYYIKSWVFWEVSRKKKNARTAKSRLESVSHCIQVCGGLQEILFFFTFN